MTDTDKPTKPKETAYDAEISPLMAQIIALCKQHKINMAAQFALDPADDDDENHGPLYCTTVIDIDEDDKEGVDRVRKLRSIMYPPRPYFAAFTIQTGPKP